MIKLAVFLISITLGSCLNTYSYTFPATATSTYQNPTYPLGYLTKNYNLTIVLQLPYGGAILTSSTVLVSIMDQTNTNTIVSFDGTSTPSQCYGGTSCTLSWNVTNSANYYLKVYSSNSNTELTNLVVYYLFAAANNQPLLRVVDVLRQHIIKYLYVSQTANLSFTLNPNPSGTYLSLLTIDPADSTKLKVKTALDITNPTTNVNSVGTYTKELTAGYYAIVVHPNVILSQTVTIQTDPYPCPYSSSFTDYFAVFQGCTQTGISSAGSGLPCISYDYSYQVCLACLSGYSVSSGVCVTSTSCPARQYYHFGVCYSVSPTCDQFDPYTGNCYSCLNPSQYQLINGQCLLTVSYCNSGFHLVNSYCISDTCGTYNPSTGACLSCITAAYYLNSTGLCVPVSCVNSSYYYSVKSSACIILPSACLNFSIAYEICYSCIASYSLINGVCVQYSNTDNCQIYSFAANVCTTCNSGYYVLNGGCIKNPTCSTGLVLVNGICILNPVTCGSNQILINSQCYNLPSNCLNLNVYLQCIQCAANNKFVGGYCVPCNGPNPYFPCVTCSSNQYISSSGVCITVSQFCGTFNSANGQCLTCTNGQAPVNGNCCDTNFVYQNGQCVQPQPAGSGSSSGSSSGSGSGSSSGGSSYQQLYGYYCQTIDPQLKICTSCLSGHYFNGGVCT